MRKTLSCERLEDCQRECSEERKFICEGFNYRLDPTGRGQGNCELIEVPLSEMDLYSSAHSRDSNLLNHPDYDYFERDRNNSPSCRIPSPCTDCGSKSSPPAVDYYPPGPPPSGYGDGSDRPHFIEPPSQAYGPYRPPAPALSASSASSSGYSGGGWMQNRYDINTAAVDYYRPPQNHYEFPSASGSGYNSRPPVDRYDYYSPRPSPVGQYEVNLRPDYRPEEPPSDFYGGGGGGSGYRPSLNKPRPSYPTPDDYNRYPPPPPSTPLRPSYNNIDRGDQGYSSKPAFIPYLIGQSYGSYGSKHSEQHNKYSVDYWGIRGNEDYRKEGSNFNYYELGMGTKYHNVPAENSVWNYPGSRYGGHESGGHLQENNYNHINHSNQWTRRPGPEGEQCLPSKSNCGNLNFCSPSSRLFRKVQRGLPAAQRSGSLYVIRTHGDRM